MKFASDELIGKMVDRINKGKCRVVIPYSAPAPIKALFDGCFKNAQYIRTYPATLYIYGKPGQVAVSCISDVSQIEKDKYVVTYGKGPDVMDLMVQVVDEL